jgi:hypothetical protein
MPILDYHKHKFKIKRTDQRGNADDTENKTESGEKDGEEDLREKNGMIWKRGNINQAGAGAEENTAIRSSKTMHN